MKLLGLLSAILLFLTGAAVSAGQPAAALSVERTSPSPGAVLPRFGSFYIAVRYAADGPLRIQARAYAHGRPLDAGQAMNASVTHPAPAGTALAWVSFDKPAQVDEIRITAYDGAWHPLQVLSLPVQARWLAEPARTYQAPPAWAQALIDEEAALATHNAPAGDGGFGGLAFTGLLIVGSLPAYLVLQFVSLAWLRRGWRMAAFVPAGAMALACVHAAFALSQASNLWLIVVILTAPLACFYLAGLLGLRMLRAWALPG